MIKRMFCISFLAVMLVGCSTVNKIYDKNGEEFTNIECYVGSLNYCYQRALELCPEGYITKNIAPSQVTGTVLIANPQTGITALPARSPANLIIKCKEGIQ